MNRQLQNNLLGTKAPLRLITSNQTDKHDQQTFIEVLRYEKQVVPGQAYSFIEWSNKNHFGTWFCVSVRYLYLEDLTDEIAYLDKNCDLATYKQIMQEIRHFNQFDRLMLCTFTQLFNVKSMSC